MIIQRKVKIKIIYLQNISKFLILNFRIYNEEDYIDNSYEYYGEEQQEMGKFYKLKIRLYWGRYGVRVRNR